MNRISFLLLLVISWQCTLARSLEKSGSLRTIPPEKEVPDHNSTKNIQGTVSVDEKSAEVYPIKKKTLSSNNSTSNSSSIDATNTFRWIQYGHPRTATTLQFQTLCYAMIVKHLSDPKSIRNLHCNYVQVPAKDQIGVVKTHVFPGGHFASENFVVFATSSGDRTKIYESLKQAGFVVPFVSDLSFVAKYGYHSVLQYKDVLGMTDDEIGVVVEAIRYWDILRLCCGMQMSEDWRNRLYPRSGYHDHRTEHDLGYHGCEIYNISQVEEDFRSTVLYTSVAQYKHLKPMLRPSTVDGDLDGTYCLRYDEHVRATGIGFNKALPNNILSPSRLHHDGIQT